MHSRRDPAQLMLSPTPLLWPHHRHTLNPVRGHAFALFPHPGQRTRGRAKTGSPRSLLGGSHLASAGGPRTPDPTRPHSTTRRGNVVVRESRRGQSDVLLTLAPTPGARGSLGTNGGHAPSGRIRPPRRAALGPQPRPQETRWPPGGWSLVGPGGHLLRGERRAELGEATPLRQPSIKVRVGSPTSEATSPSSHLCDLNIRLHDLHKSKERRPPRAFASDLHKTTAKKRRFC